MINCVIGAAAGYHARHIRPFLKSLRDSGYSNRIVLFVDGGAAEEAKKWDVQIQPVPKLKTTAHADRFSWIYDKVKTIDAEGILCLDTRDVIFQKNPALLPSYTLHAFSEDDSQTIGSCPYNSKWVEIGYGVEGLAKLKDKSILCVGSFCGAQHYVQEHLEKLVKEIHRCKGITREHQDQSCHNWLIYTDNKNQSCIWGNENDKIYTVGYVPFGTVPVVDDKILNRAGEIPTVIHQWDRHPNLTELVQRLYC